MEDVIQQFSNLLWFTAVFVFTETPVQLQRRNVSFVIPKSEDTKKRVLEQSQLLDGMLL